MLKETQELILWLFVSYTISLHWLKIVHKYKTVYLTQDSEKNKAKKVL
jgi:hypothetical protein